MAQLIKLHHFPSRYETNIYQYSSRFTQRKQRLYEKFSEKKGLYEPEEEIKAQFYDELFKRQLIWATTTPKMEATTKGEYHRDTLLKHVLRTFDDTALVLYHPTFDIGGTEIDCELVLLTPLAVWCVQVVIGEIGSVFQGVNVSEWQEITSEGVRFLENPYTALNQSVNTIQQIFDEHQMEAEIRGCIYVPESYVEFVQYGSSYDCIDRTKVKEWTSKINHHRSILKHGQLRAAELLLKKTKTSARLRVL